MVYMYISIDRHINTPYMYTARQIPTGTFMSACAFWRVSYFAVFFTEYLNFSWYNLIDAYIFSISI